MAGLNGKQSQTAALTIVGLPIRNNLVLNCSFYARKQIACRSGRALHYASVAALLLAGVRGILAVPTRKPGGPWRSTWSPMLSIGALSCLRIANRAWALPVSR